jgi:hypothetical protein
LVNYITLLLTHGLIAVALWRLLFRPDLDADGAEPRPPRRPWRKGAAPEGGPGDA